MHRTISLGEILAGKGKDVHTISPESTVHEAVTALVQQRVGSLVVTRGERVVGIITERDVLCESAQHFAEIDTTPVEKIMTREVICGRTDYTVNEGLWLMTERHIRHLPILDGERLVGIVSIGDLAKARLDEVTDENHHLIRYVTDQYPG